MVHGLWSSISCWKYNGYLNHYNPLLVGFITTFSFGKQHVTIRSTCKCLCMRRFKEKNTSQTQVFVGFVWRKSCDMLGLQKSWAALVCHFLEKNDPHPPLLASTDSNDFTTNLLGFLQCFITGGGQNSCLVGPLVPHFWATPTPRKHEPAKYQAGTQESWSWPRIGSHPLQDPTDWVDKSTFRFFRSPRIYRETQQISPQEPQSVEPLESIAGLPPWVLGLVPGGPHFVIQCLKCPLVTALWKTLENHHENARQMIYKWAIFCSNLELPPDIYLHLDLLGYGLVATGFLFPL